MEWRCRAFGVAPCLQTGCRVGVHARTFPVLPLVSQNHAHRESKCDCPVSSESLCPLKETKLYNISSRRPSWEVTDEP